MLSYIERITSATTIEDAWPIHCEAMAEVGFNRLFYGMTRSRTPDSLGNREDFVVLTNLDPSYTEPYFDEGLYKVAPMNRWVLRNSGSKSWRYISDQLGTLNDDERRVLEWNAQHGIRSGYSISFHKVTARSIAAIALIADAHVPQHAVDQIWDEHGREIEAMNNVMHLKVMQLPYSGAEKTLTKRQRETLEWVGEGKTTQDIGIIMGLTAATVEKHLRLAREALDVETTAQAVVKASFQNQIFLVDGFI